MNGDYIIKYAGRPVKLPGVKLVTAREATVYPNRQDAWWAANENNLPVGNIAIVPLNEELDREIA
jgi:hypothetical protein